MTEPATRAEVDALRFALERLTSRVIALESEARVRRVAAARDESSPRARLPPRDSK